MKTFCEALMSHMLKQETSITELVDQTGVSRDIINKLKARPTSSTNVETAMKIAAFYGKTVNQFVADDDDKIDEFANLVEVLTPDERKYLVPLLRGIVLNRED